MYIYIIIESLLFIPVFKVKKYYCVFIIRKKGKSHAATITCAMASCAQLCSHSYTGHLCSKYYWIQFHPLDQWARQSWSCFESALYIIHSVSLFSIDYYNFFSDSSFSILVYYCSCGPGTSLSPSTASASCTYPTLAPHFHSKLPYWPSWNAWTSSHRGLAGDL